jgi:hypothetical protein
VEDFVSVRSEETLFILRICIVIPYRRLGI